MQRIVSDENVDWNNTLIDIFNFIRAITHLEPMARAFIGGKEIKINKAELISEAVIYKCITGSILNINKTGVLVKTAESFVKITEYICEEKLKVGNRFDVR